MHGVFPQFVLLGYCMSYGDIYRIVNGYDDCGNVCGRKNEFFNENTGCKVRECFVIYKDIVKDDLWAWTLSKSDRTANILCPWRPNTTISITIYSKIYWFICHIFSVSLMLCFRTAQQHHYHSREWTSVNIPICMSFPRAKSSPIPPSSVDCAWTHATDIRNSK